MIRNFELIYPSYDWYNLFKEYVGEGFKTVMREAFSRANKRCGICGERHPKLMYPIFYIDDNTREFVLKRIIVVCPICNQMLKVSTLSNEEEAVVEHMKTVLKKSPEETREYLHAAHERYKETQKYGYDFSILWYKRNTSTKPVF